MVSGSCQRREAKVGHDELVGMEASRQISGGSRLGVIDHDNHVCINNTLNTTL